MAARKLHTVGFECLKLVANSLFMDSRKLFVRFSLLIVLGGLGQDDQQTQPREQLSVTQGQYCVTGNVIFYMIDLCNNTVFMTFMYVYHPIVLSCYFSNFVILYLTRDIYDRHNSSDLTDLGTKIWGFFPKTATFCTPKSKLYYAYYIIVLFIKIEIYKLNQGL